MTVKTRITLFVAGAGFIASLLFSIIVFYELIEQPFDILDTELEIEAHRAIKIIDLGHGKSTSTAPNPASHEIYPYWLKIYEKDAGRPFYQSGMATRIPLPPVAPGSHTITSVVPPGQVNPEQDSHRKLTFRVRTFTLPLEGRNLTVQIGRPMAKLNEEIRELILGIIAGLVFSTLILVAISYFIAGKILKPIGAMKDLAHNVSEKNLEQRLPVGAVRDEFNELARTINKMLDRLQYSFVRQRDFLFDTSHELKTPLTTMRLAIEDICTSDMAVFPSFPKETLFRLNDQVLRMERLVKDLLNLSSLEISNGIDSKPVYLTRLLSSLAADYQFLVDAHNIHMDIRLPDHLVVHGDEKKINRAFSNILDNAIKYNVDGGCIAVDGKLSDTEMTVTIANTGPGVAETEVDKVFEQFYRVEKSRSIQHGGSGLGLAIVKRIIELHGGKVKFESKQGAWTRITICLPRHMEMVSD